MKRRRKAAVIAGISGLAVALGFGAFHLLPHLLLHSATEKLERDAQMEAFYRKFEPYSTKQPLEWIRRGGSEADAELARWAEENPRRVWIPERRMVLVEENYLMPGAPEEMRGLASKGIPGLLKMASADDDPGLFIYHYWTDIRTMKWTGRELEIEFKVLPVMAAKLGVSEKTLWKAALPLDDVVGLLRGQSQGQVLKEMMEHQPKDAPPPEFLLDWLRKADALPATEPGT